MSGANRRGAKRLAPPTGIKVTEEKSQICLGKKVTGKSHKSYYKAFIDILCNIL